MNLTELKKTLYKEKPIAKLKWVSNVAIFYETEIIEGAAPVFFKVPISDIGDAKFLYEMDAKLLIRYIVEPNES